MTKIESQEAVLVVPRTVIDPVAPKVFNRAVEPVKAAVLANFQFLERHSAEQDLRYKKIIPYVLIRHEDRYLLIRRTSKQTESRLHDMYSLGIGGHINNGDVSGASADLLTAGMRRKLAEEIQIET